MDPESSRTDGGGGGSRDDDEMAATPARRRRPPSVATSLRRVRQQTLPSFTPTLSVRTMVFLYYGLGLLFVPIGIAVLVGSARIGRSDTLRYDTLCPSNVSVTPAAAAAAGASTGCVLPLVVRSRIKAPSYFYYRVTGMQQNARRYVKSRSHKQLRGEWPLSADELRQCAPLTYVGDTLVNGGSVVDEEELDEDATAVSNASATPAAVAAGGGSRTQRQVLVPCGLTAASEFNDTLELCADNRCASPIPLSTDGIAWDADTEVAFRPRVPVAPPWTSAINARITSERFMVWMRLSAFADFDKLYGIIRSDLPAGTYYIGVGSHFPVAPFGGTKSVFVANTTWFGGRNVFLGVTYVVVGLLCLAGGTAFLTYHLARPRRRAYDDPALVQAALARLTSAVPRSARRRRGGGRFGRGGGRPGVAPSAGGQAGPDGEKVT